jgi:PST family polysaccharide transporter
MLAMKTMKGAAWLIGSRFLGRGIDFFTLLIFARLLSPADFGLTALALTVVLIVDTVLEVPVTQALTRLPTIDRRHLDTGFTLNLLRGLLIALFVLAAAWPVARFYDNPELAPIMLALAAGPVIRSFASPRMVHFVREMSFWQLFATEMTGKMVAVTAAISTVLAGGGHWALVVNFATGGAVGAMVSYAFAPYRPRLSLARFSDFAGFVGWFSLSQLVSALNWQSDRLLLGAYIDKPSLGRYAVANDVALLPTQSLISPAMAPVMAAFARIADDRERQRGAFLKASRLAMLLAAPMAVGISLLADLVVALLLGPQWHAAAPFLALLAISVMGIPYFQVIYALALAVNRPAVIFRLNAVELGLRAVLLPLGLFILSAAGVALARIGVAAIMSGVYLLQVRALAGLGLRAQLANLWKIALATAAMALAVLLLRRGLAPLAPAPLIEAMAAVAVGVASYVAALLLCGLRLGIGPGRLELVDRW